MYLATTLTANAAEVIFTQLIDRVKPRTKSAHQTLILAHRKELVEQAAKHCMNAYPEKTVEIEMGAVHASGVADITVASLQSIVSGDRISKFDPQRFNLVLVDEAHHIVSPGYMRTLDHFGLSEAQEASPYLVGVSATLSRFDGLKLGIAIDEIVYHKDYIDMIGEKWLSDVIFTTVQTKADISKVKKGINGDFQPAELSEAVNTDQVNELTVRSWFAKAGERKSTLAFCVDLNHVGGLTNKFREHGVDAQFITGDTKKTERSARLDAFRRGEFPVLVNCGIFTEGTDIPNIDCVLLARPTKSRNLLVQMIGRGMRLHPSKKDCHVIDMVATLETGIITVPTLFGLDPSEILEDAGVDDMQTLQTRREAEEERKKSAAERGGVSSSAVKPISTLVFTDYDSVYDLIDDTSNDQFIRRLSTNAWVNTGPNTYVLSDRSGSYVRLEKEPDPDIVEWTIVENARLFGSSKSPFAKTRKVAQAVTFADAVHAADTYVNKKYQRNFISRDQAWRNGPATEGQLMFLNRLRPQGDQLTPGMMTKGKAADMITKMKHGAKGRFATFEANKRREQKARFKGELEEAQKKRETVSVGPLLD